MLSHSSEGEEVGVPACNQIQVASLCHWTLQKGKKTIENSYDHKFYNSMQTLLVSVIF